MSEPKIKLGKYRHFKGQEYMVEGLARHSETLEWMVIYRCLYDNPEGKVWVRPLKMFLEKVEVDGKKISRFEYINSK
jgi:hypothetical protein